MFSVRRRLLLINVLLAVSLPLHAEAPPLQTTLTPFKPRLKAPDVELPDLNDQKVSLAKLKGKVVVINFWATWCPPCRREFASMDRLRELMDGRPVEILAINEGESVDVIEGFTATMDKLPGFTILLDQSGDAMAFWPVHGLPTTFIIDKRGRMAYRAIGGREFDSPNIVGRIEALLKEKR